MKKLPIGQQSFENLQSADCVYIDKTASIHRLIDSGSWYYFLSRPRRFGKSLLLSTIKAVFEGRKELFEGLYIYDKIDWERYPVILLDMSRNAESLDTLKKSLAVGLKGIASGYAIELDYEDPVIIFSEFIRLLYEKTGKQVILLIDEYDKPILDAIIDLERATEIRAFLQGFYTVIKSSGAYLRFVLLTGVSKISQTSIFSGLNNLDDISTDDKYTDICGYTQQELETGFGEYISVLAEKYEITHTEMLAKIKHWYNGYSWNGKTFVYNPFSVLLLLDKKNFEPHWFNTGTPGFLIKLLKSKNDFSLLLQKEIEVNINFANKQALENMDIVPLCFQTGYLTIKRADFKTATYWLQIPNEEVRIALSESILVDFTGQSDYQIHVLAKNIRNGFDKGDVDKAVDNLRILFSQIGYNTHLPSESHYHALFQLTMNLAGIDQRSESYTNIGRSDSVLTFKDRVYVIEIKYAKSKKVLASSLKEAMAQIKKMRYHEPFLHQGREVHLLALAFTKGAMDYRNEVI